MSKNSRTTLGTHVNNLSHTVSRSYKERLLLSSKRRRGRRQMQYCWWLMMDQSSLAKKKKKMEKITFLCVWQKQWHNGFVKNGNSRISGYAWGYHPSHLICHLLLECRLLPQSQPPWSRWPSHIWNLFSGTDDPCGDLLASCTFHTASFGVWVFLLSAEGLHDFSDQTLF